MAKVYAVARNFFKKHMLLNNPDTPCNFKFVSGTELTSRIMILGNNNCRKEGQGLRCIFKRRPSVIPGKRK